MVSDRCQVREVQDARFGLRDFGLRLEGVSYEAMGEDGTRVLMVVLYDHVGRAVFCV